jgi:hypothetical protein
VKNAYKRLWNASYELLEEFRMEIMPNIGDASPSELSIEEVEEKREVNRKVIEKLTKSNKEFLNEYLMKPITLIKLSKLLSKIPRKT